MEASTKPLRKCRVCGLEAHSDEDLKLFAKDNHGNKLNRENFCFKCFNAYRRDLARKRKESGLCTHCGQPRDREGAVCSKCLEKKKTYITSDNRLSWNMARRQVRWNLKKEVMEKLGGKCVICGITDLRLLTINHLNGRGLSRTLDANSEEFYKAILRGERKDVDVRCYNHNILYEYERGNRWQPEEYLA